MWRHAQYPGINVSGYIQSHSTPDTELNLGQHSTVDGFYVFAHELYMIRPDHSLPITTSNGSPTAQGLPLKMSKVLSH